MLFVDLESLDGHILLGRAHFALKDLGSSRAEFERVLEFDPASIEAVLWLARCDRAEGSLSTAIERIRRLLSEHPESAEAASLLKELEQMAE
jgi:tetratricopeptide (TPR) repeat protein